MLKNYIMIALREIRKKPGFSIINISGLVIAMTSFILISLWVLDELSYNSFNDNYDRIYGVVNDQYFNNKIWHGSSTPHLLAAAIKEEFPEAVHASRYQNAGEVMINYKDVTFFEKSLRYVDPDFFDIFTFPVVAGDKHNILSDPYKIAISEDMAKKYFGDENPVGKSLLLNNQELFNVSGVFRKAPGNSTINPELLISYEYCMAQNQKRGWQPAWLWNSPYTFILLNSKSDWIGLNGKVKDFVKEKSQNQQAPEFSLVPLKDVRFSPYYDGEDRMKSILIFSGIALLILIVACMNFLSLSVAGTFSRAKEIGIRKASGANRRCILNQFLAEYFILCIISLVLAFIIAILLLPRFNLIINKTLDISIFYRSSTFMVLLAIIIFTGLVGGGYPASRIASIKPASIFTGYIAAKGKTVSLRRIFVVFQFILSVTLIVLMTVILRQLKFMKTTSQGMVTENVIVLEFKGGSEKNYYVLKESLSKIPVQCSITGGASLPTGIFNNTASISWAGKSPDDKPRVHFSSIDYDFCKTFNIELVEGKEFSKYIPPSEREGVVVNQEFLKLMGKNTGVGEKITRDIEGGQIELRIIGVVKNFHFASMNDKIAPLVLQSLYAERNRMTPRFLLVRIDPSNLSTTIELIKKTWNEINPAFPFEYRFLGAEMDANYRIESTQATIISSFTFIAVVISFLGLFGLAFYSAEQRTRELAIRKVFGSSICRIAGLLFKEYFLMVVIACIIAWPIGYHLATRWLQKFAYKINIDVWIFALAGISALLIAALSVGYQSIKASVANPIDSIARE